MVNILTRLKEKRDRIELQTYNKNVLKLEKIKAERKKYQKYAEARSDVAREKNLMNQAKQEIRKHKFESSFAGKLVKGAGKLSKSLKEDQSKLTKAQKKAKNDRKKELERIYF